MNTSFKIIGLLVAVFLLAIAGIFIISGKPADLAPDSPGGSNAAYSTSISNGGSSGAPQASTSVAGSDTTAITTFNGRLLQVKDFTTHLSTTTDSNKVDHHYFDYPQDTAADMLPYVIEYFDDNTSFAVYLLEEPIKEVRSQAEQYLLNLLGIAQTDLCQLRYSVSVPYTLNPLYAGRDLGFSFCPTSVQLP